MQNMQNIKWDTSLSQEWLANADDAKASEFAIVLDTTTYGNSTLIDKKMQDWQEPSLMIYNNSKFKDQDWNGFTEKVGNSVKKENTDTIGTCGLTMYHFTD